jgi:hypothetical protein
MSSPKAAREVRRPKAAVRAAPKAAVATDAAATDAAKPVPVVPPAAASKPLAGASPAAGVSPAGDASAEALRLAAEIERALAAGQPDVLTQAALQKLMAALCRTYSAQIDAGSDLTPVAMRSLNSTDVMLTASGLLRASNLAVFELGMWQSWTGR